MYKTGKTESLYQIFLQQILYRKILRLYLNKRTFIFHEGILKIFFYKCGV